MDVFEYSSHVYTYATSQNTSIKYKIIYFRLFCAFCDKSEVQNNREILKLVALFEMCFKDIVIIKYDWTKVFGKLLLLKHLFVGVIGHEIKGIKIFYLRLQEFKDLKKENDISRNWAKGNKAFRRNDIFQT